MAVCVYARVYASWRKTSDFLTPTWCCCVVCQGSQTKQRKKGKTRPKDPLVVGRALLLYKGEARGRKGPTRQINEPPTQHNTQHTQEEVRLVVDRRCGWYKRTHTRGFCLPTQTKDKQSTWAGEWHNLCFALLGVGPVWLALGGGRRDG